MATKDQLVNLGETLIRQGGADAVSFRDLAASLGIKSASVHYHFPTKDAFLASVVMSYLQRLMAALGLADDPTETPRDRLSRLTDYFVAMGTDDQGACPLAALAATRVRLGPLATSAIDQASGALLDWLDQALVGRLRADLTLGSLQGALLLTALRDDPGIIEAAEADLLSRL